MADIVYRSRSASEILDASFELLRQHYRTFVTATAVAYLPLAALNIVGNRALGLEAALERGELHYSMLFVFAAQIVWFGLINALVASLASSAYLQRPLEPEQAWKLVLRRSPAIIGITILVTILSMIGLVLLVFPGIYVYTRYGLSPIVAVLEPSGTGSALGRSSVLSRKRKRHIFAVLLMSFAVLFVVMIGLAMASTLLASALLSNVLGSIFTILAWPLIPIVQTVLYYDLRIRAEGYDVELMSQQLGASPEAHLQAAT
jgi:hypothetical protein